MEPRRARDVYGPGRFPARIEPGGVANLCLALQLSLKSQIYRDVLALELGITRKRYLARLRLGALA